MKVLHVPYTFHPNPVGGTEVYVEALARLQREQGMDAGIAAPGDRDRIYEHAGLPIWRFAVADKIEDVSELYGPGDPAPAEAFARVLDAAQPDLLHMHAFTSASSLCAIREAKRRRIPVLFTYHTPTVSCPRGTLLRWGNEVCDGVLETRRCAPCALHAAGMNRFASGWVGSIPPAVGRSLERGGLSGGVWTALRMSQLVELHHRTFRSFVNDVDHIVAVCQWVKRVLIANDVPEEKVTVCRQGLVQTTLSVRPASQPPQRGLRMAFLGRLDPTKGIHVLIKAFRAVQEPGLALDVYGVSQNPGSAAYGAQMADLAKGDPRIRFLAPVPAGQVVPVLREYDVLAVPSQWLESGPLVVLEAFAAGIPVLGSKLGGIAELVRHDIDGLLVEAASAEAWAAAIRELARDRTLISRLRTNVRPPRRMADVAGEMDQIYRRFVPAQHAHRLYSVH